MPASDRARRSAVLCGLHSDAIWWRQDRWGSGIEKPDIMSRFDELAKTEVAWRESEAQRERQPAKHTIPARAHVPAKWDPVRRQGHAPTRESTARPVHIGSLNDPIWTGRAVVAAFPPDHTSGFATWRDRNGDVLPEPGRHPDDIVRAEHAGRFKRDPYRRSKTP